MRFPHESTQKLDSLNSGRVGMWGPNLVVTCPRQDHVQMQRCAYQIWALRGSKCNVYPNLSSGWRCVGKSYSAASHQPLTAMLFQSNVIQLPLLLWYFRTNICPQAGLKEPLRHLFASQYGYYLHHNALDQGRLRGTDLRRQTGPQTADVRRCSQTLATSCRHRVNGVGRGGGQAVFDQI